MIKKRWARALAIGLGILICACSKPEAVLSFQEQLDLGQKFLTELNYEQAIIELTKAIGIDPRNVDAHRMLAEAYSAMDMNEEAAASRLEVVILQTPQPEEDAWEDDVTKLLEELEMTEDHEQADVLAEMAYAQTNDSRFLSFLFKSKGKQRDFEAVKRLISEADMIVDSMHDEYLESLLQYYYDEKDYESMQALAEALGETEVSPGIPLILDLLAAYNENGQESIIAYLEGFFERGDKLPYIEDDGEVYVGDRDENGHRNGFGICYYGANVKPDSRIYVGYWKDDLRSGEGRAYRTANYRIQCSWADDYPTGEVNILQNETTVIGTLNGGHVATPMNLYENGEWTAVHCTPDSSRETGYSFQTVRMDNPGTCQHVEKHSYCWDCQQKAEQRKEAE